MSNIYQDAYIDNTFLTHTYYYHLKPRFVNSERKEW